MIVLYGATGYTGRLTARELHRFGARFEIAGRNPRKLEALSQELGGVPVRVAEGTGQLDGLANDASVLISTVGPFELYGERAVAEAVRAGAHFVDTTGEQGYMRRVLDRFDDEARAKGVAVLNAQAFEFAVSYCLCAALLAEAPDTHTIDVFNRASSLETSRGTKKSGLRAGAGAALVLRDGVLVDRGLSPVPMKAEWTDGREVAAAPFPGGEALHLLKIAPRIRNVTTNLVLPTAAAWGMTSMFSMRPLLRGLQKTRALSWIESRIDSGAEGPSAEVARATRWGVLVRARGPYGERAAHASGNDVYGISGTIAALAGLWLDEGRARTAGVVSTGEAFDPRAFLDALADRGVAYEV